MSEVEALRAEVAEAKEAIRGLISELMTPEVIAARFSRSDEPLSRAFNVLGPPFAQFEW